jgi:hypothetical protein
VPVLARVIEEAGIATVIVTMMPDIAQKFRLSRVVAVEFPFGHAFGMPGDTAMQRAVCETAIALLDTATGPETRVDVPIEWPQDTAFAYRDWQPSEPSPIVAYNMRRRQEAESQGGGGQ